MTDATSKTSAANRTMVSVPIKSVTIVCVVWMLAGTYAVVAAVWVSSQLAEPGAASVPRFWMKSLVVFPIRTTLYTAPTILVAGLVSIVLWRLIGAKTADSWRGVFAFAGLIAFLCWMIRFVAKFGFRRQWFMHSPAFDLIVLLAFALVGGGIVGLSSRRATGAG